MSRKLLIICITELLSVRPSANCHFHSINLCNEETNWETVATHGGKRGSDLIFTVKNTMIAKTVARTHRSTSQSHPVSLGRDKIKLLFIWQGIYYVFKTEQNI